MTIQPLMGLPEVADYIGLSKPTIYRWWHDGKLPVADFTNNDRPLWLPQNVGYWWAHRV